MWRRSGGSKSQRKVEEIEFSGKDRPKQGHDEKCQYKGRYGKAFLCGVARKAAAGFLPVLIFNRGFFIRSSQSSHLPSLLIFNRILCYNLLIYILLFFEHEM